MFEKAPINLVRLMKKQTMKQSKTTKCTVECKWLQKLKKGKASIKSAPPADLQRQNTN